MQIFSTSLDRPSKKSEKKNESTYGYFISAIKGDVESGSLFTGKKGKAFMKDCVPQNINDLCNI